MGKAKEVVVWQEEECRYSLDGKTKNELIAYLSSLTLPEDATLDIGTEDYYGCTSAYVKWIFKRPETVEEKVIREYREKEQQEYRRRQYEQLSKEFAK